MINSISLADMEDRSMVHAVKSKKGVDFLMSDSISAQNLYGRFNGSCSKQW